MFDTPTYQARRAAVAGQLGAGVAVVPAAQRADFAWLTGCAEPDAVLVLEAGAAGRATLFLPARDPARERWDGPRLGPEAAPAALGVDAAYPLAELDAVLPGLLRGAEPLWYGFGRAAAFDARLLALWPGLGDRRTPTPRTVRDPAAVVHALRLVKAPEELAAMRRAAAITAEGFAAARAAVRPGAIEYELEAALTGTWRRLGADGPAYPPIVAAGAHATVLHHRAAAGVLAGGELVLVDAGAQAGGYACDVTRTWAVGAPRGRLGLVLEAVRAAHGAAIAAVRPGAPVDAPQRAAEAVLAEGLAALGLDPAGLGRWFPHRVGHWIGLEVHDPAVPEAATLEPGMALTVEPGLYFAPDDPDAPADLRGVGVRHEDTVVVTAVGAEVLTAAIPA